MPQKTPITRANSTGDRSLPEPGPDRPMNLAADAVNRIEAVEIAYPVR